MTEFLLRHLRPSVPFLISSERTQRKFLKQALGNFGEGGMKSRIQAFLFVREMAISLPAPNLTLAMKVKLLACLYAATSLGMQHLSLTEDGHTALSFSE